MEHQLSVRYKRTSKQMRYMRDMRLKTCIKEVDKKQARAEIEKTKKIDHAKMKEVENFFVEIFPEKISEDVEEQISKTYINGSKSIYGMILFIDKLVDFPDWRRKAFEHFNINI